MTLEMEKSIRFIQDSAKAAGFGTQYHQAIENGIKAGEKEFALEPAWKQYDSSTTMLWQPKVTQQEKNPERYNLGYSATLVKENVAPVTQFFSIYNLSGAMLEQSKALLEGSTVAISDWDNKKGERREILASLDLSKTPKEGENHTVQRIPIVDLRIGTLYSKEDIVASQVEKDRHLKMLQSGAEIEVTLREFVNKVPQFKDATLKFDIVNGEQGLRLAMAVKDTEGQVLRTHSIEPRQANETLGMVVGMEKNKMPENLLKLLGKEQKPAGEGTTNELRKLKTSRTRP